MSSENGSFSTAMATFTDDGSLPLSLAFSAASAMAEARYCSDVERTAKMYFRPLLKSEREAPSASTIGILYFSVMGAIALVRPEEYGPSMYCTLSWLMSRSASVAPRSPFDSSS